MCNMSKASMISKGVWLGLSPDVLLSLDEEEQRAANKFDLLIEANDLASIPNPRLLDRVRKDIENSAFGEPHLLQFPSSGSVVPQLEANRDVDDFISTIRWMYYLVNPEEEEEDVELDDLDDISIEGSNNSRRILIHCADGYTESSLLAIAYFMFAEGLPLHEAWIRLHREKGRNFFAYPSDVFFLREIEQRLLQESPVAQARGLELDSVPAPAWLQKMDGSLPSRVLPYMYLGNLAHANNPELLQALGIKRVLSIGEPVSWSDEEIDEWGEDNLMFIGQVQDNGIDPLTLEFDNCLSFIGKFMLTLLDWYVLMFDLYRERQSRWVSYIGTLSRWCFKVCYHLHSRGNGVPGTVISSSIVSSSPKKHPYSMTGHANST
jgi:dual specificity MAP kinase phosphatase